MRASLGEGGVWGALPHRGRSLPSARLLALAFGVAVAAAAADAHPLHAHRAPGRARTRAAAPAGTDVAAAVPSPVVDALASERLTGEWLGARSWLRERGVSIEATWVSDTSRPLRGGVRRRTAFRSLLDVNTTVDLDALLGWSGATLFADAYGIWGRNGSDDVGDFQGFSNIDADDDRVQLAELWLQQELFDGALRLKLGKFDANSEFAFVDAAGDFLNSSAGFSPTIFPMVTYPDPATGVLVAVDPSGPLYAVAGVFDGAGAAGVPTGVRGPRTFFRDDVSDDWFAIGELGLAWDDGARFGPGRVAVGPWHHTARFDRFDGGTTSGATGFFALLEQRVVSLAAEGEDAARDVRVFGQYGWADEDVSEAHHHASAGLLVTGPCAERADDSAGVLLTWVDLSDRAGAGFPRDEATVELFYRAALTPAISLKPDLQVVESPSGGRTHTAIVGTLRIEVGL
ncbi:MAG: carbohydrate porin [Myxococcota bacterium]